MKLTKIKEFIHRLRLWVFTDSERVMRSFRYGDYCRLCIVDLNAKVLSGFMIYGHCYRCGQKRNLASCKVEVKKGGENK